MDVIREGDPAVAPSAAKALEQLGAASVKDELIALLVTEKPATRHAVAYVLGRLGDQSALDPLKKRVADEKDKKVGKALREAIDRLENPDDER